MSAGVLALLMTAGGPGAAAASPVEQFNVQIKNVTANGRFSVAIASNSFDTTGGPPPGIAEASVRFPKGMTIEPEFLRHDRLCETRELRAILLASQTKRLTYQAMLKDLATTRKRIAGRLQPLDLKILDTCRKAFVGRGKFVLDPRPNYPDVIPGSMYSFLSLPTAKGAIGGFGVLAIFDQTAPIVRNTPLLTEQRPGFTLNLFDKPSPDGLYGYRMQLLPENTGGLPFSVAELNVGSKGIVSPDGRFWTRRPHCPATSKLRFKATYHYRTGLRTTKVISVPCLRFKP